MTASDAESLTMRDLLSMATADEREEFEQLWLGYTETFGAPDLRETIAALYQRHDASNVLCFAGASEGIYAANNVLLDKDSHAICITPNYQSHESLPSAICATTAVPLQAERGWSLDVDRVRQAVRPNTRLITLNFPHNPTGAMLPRDRLEALVALCRQHGIYIFSDEIFNGLGRTGTKHMPYVADIYERGLSLNVTSKAYGLAGLRVGWIVCAEREILAKMEKLKHYLSISNSAPSERLARIAIRNRDRILARNCEIIDRNVVKLDDFFSRHANLFDWQVSDASCIAFPLYKGVEGVEVFTKRLVEEAGVLLLPASLYQSELAQPLANRFRIGFGRTDMDAGLAAMDEHIASIHA